MKEVLGKEMIFFIVRTIKIWNLQVEECIFQLKDYVGLVSSHTLIYTQRNFSKALYRVNY